MFPKDERFGHSRSSMVRSKAREMLLAGDSSVTRPCTPPTVQRTLFEHPNKHETRFETQSRTHTISSPTTRTPKYHRSKRREGEENSGVSERNEDEEKSYRSSRCNQSRGSKRSDMSDSRARTASSTSSSLSLSRPVSSSSSSHLVKECKQQGVFDAEENEGIDEAQRFASLVQKAVSVLRDVQHHRNRDNFSEATDSLKELQSDVIQINELSRRFHCFTGTPLENKYRRLKREMISTATDCLDLTTNYDQTNQTSAQCDSMALLAVQLGMMALIDKQSWPSRIVPHKRESSLDTAQHLKLFTHSAYCLAKKGTVDDEFRSLRVLDALLDVLPDIPDEASKKEPLNDTQLHAVSQQLGALLYAVATIKFMSAVPRHQRYLAQQGMIFKLSYLMDVLSHLNVPSLALEIENDELCGNETSQGVRGNKDVVTPVHVLVQVLATLRNLSLDSRHFSQFDTAGTSESLGRCVLTYHWHAEFMFNCARLIAKLSVHPRGRKAIMKDPRLSNTIVAFMQYQCLKSNDSSTSNLDMNNSIKNSVSSDQESLWLSGSVRACFALGNLIAGNPTNRKALGTSAVLIRLVDLLAQLTETVSSSCVDNYAFVSVTGKLKDVGVGSETDANNVHTAASDRTLTASGRWGDKVAERNHGDSQEGGREKHTFQKPSSVTTEEQLDLLAKVARCLANMALDGDLADTLGGRQEISCLVDAVQLAQNDNTLSNICSPLRHELLQNVTAATTNLSFYDNNNNALWVAREDLLQVLAQVLLSQESQTDCVHEALRGLGNISRDLALHDEIVDLRIHEVLFILLEHEDSRVVFDACGVLVNLTSSGQLDVVQSLQNDTITLGRLAHLASFPRASKDSSLAIVAQKVLFNTCCTLGVDAIKGLDMTAKEQLQLALDGEADEDLVSLLRTSLLQQAE